MPIKKQWICDGCDKATTTGMNDVADYYQIKITAGAWGKDVVICRDCHDQLLETIDPTNWIRAPRAA